MVNYRIGKCIGCGTFGKVFMVKDFYNNVFAMKRLSVYNISSKEKKQIINEIRILKYNICPYLIKLVECKANLTNIELIMNYAHFGDLLTIISKNRRKIPIKQFEEQLVWSYFIQVCYGVKYLHDNNIIHRDLKCGNVFLDRGDRVYIGDFGTTKVFIDNNKLTNSSVGTPYYMSPEIMNNDKYDQSVDIWGLGCFLFEIITYYPPFMGRNIKHLTLKIRRSFLRVTIPLIYYLGYLKESLTQ